MIDKGLYKNGRKGFFTGAQADTKEGKSMSPGTSASGGSRNTNGGNNNNIVGGGADFSTVPNLPPVMTTLPSNIPTSDNKTFTISTNPMDLKEQYKVGNVPTNITGVPSFVTFDNPYSSLGLEQQRYDNFVDARNLANMEYPGVTSNVPAFIPYSTAINAGVNLLSGIIGAPGFKINTKFFAENVAGKYGYGYGYEDYKQYMKDRMEGKVSAYGNPALGQNEINRRSNDGSGIMQVSQVNPLLPIEEEDDDEENQTAKNYDFNYGTASNPIYYSDLV